MPTDPPAVGCFIDWARSPRETKVFGFRGEYGCKAERKGIDGWAPSQGMEPVALFDSNTTLRLVLMQGSSRECLGSADKTVDFIYGDGTMQHVEAGRPAPSSALSRVCCRLSFNLPEYTRLSSVTEEAAYRCMCWTTLRRDLLPLSVTTELLGGAGQIRRFC